MDNPREQTLGGFLREFRKEITAYIEARVELTRLATYDKTALLASATIFFVILVGLVSIIVFLLSIALSMYLGKILGANYYGFTAVAGIYLLAGLVLYIFRKSISEKIQNTTLEILMKTDQKKNEGNDESEG